MITTHVLDTSIGQPAERIPVELDVFISGHGWRDAGRGVTNSDGRILDFGEVPAAGVYRLMFDIGAHIPDAFFPTISITFEVSDPNDRYHIPLLLSPFGYTTYRGKLMTIVENRYGKARVRVARIVRKEDRHEFHEMTVAIALEGDFDSSYRDGDNSLVLPTDTMKNTVYALAQDPAVERPESFALLLANHFLSRLNHVSCVKIDIHEHLWQRDGAFSFTAGPPHRRIAKISANRDQIATESGVSGYLLMKTTGSAFEGFLRDEHTTLPEASDRILATSLDASWKHDGSAHWDSVMKLMTNTFAGHASKSVQHTLHAIGEAVLEKHPGIEQIRLTMPNKHYLPTRHADVFMPTDEPHGLIEAVLSR